MLGYKVFEKITNNDYLWAKALSFNFIPINMLPEHI